MIHYWWSSYFFTENTVQSNWLMQYIPKHLKRRVILRREVINFLKEYCTPFFALKCLWYRSKHKKLVPLWYTICYFWFNKRMHIHAILTNKPNLMPHKGPSPLPLGVWRPARLPGHYFHLAISVKLFILTIQVFSLSFWTSLFDAVSSYTN